MLCASGSAAAVSPMAGWHPKLLDNQLCSHHLSPLGTINIHVDVKAVKIP